MNYTPASSLNHRAYNYNLISFKSCNSQLFSKFLESGSYRAQLARAIGVSAERLSSILEPEELKEILKTAKPENFSTGENFENILNGTYKINLHMHTNNSDGAALVEDYLTQAKKYADYRKNLGLHEPLVLMISDHDSLEGCKKAVKIIAQNPQKYKNIRLATGVEANTVYNSKQLETLCYCVNPFDENLNAFFDLGREQNKKYLQDFIKNNLSKWEENAGIPAEKRTTLESLTKFAHQSNVDGAEHLDYFGSPGLMYGFTNSLKKLFSVRGWHYQGIDKFSQMHGLQHGSFAINPGTPSLKSLIGTVKTSSDGFLGIAHPCRNLGGFDLRNLFPEFKKLGIDAVEANYQYPINDARFPKAFQNHVELAANQSNMLKAGGGDNHTNNIFSNKFNIENLPETVQSIILSQNKTNSASSELKTLEMVA